MKNKKKSFQKYLMILSVMLIVALASGIKARAAASVVIKEINYENSTMTVQMSANDSLLFISDDKQKKWECVPVEKDSNDQITFDISWVSSTKNYVMSLKGDESVTPVKVTIPKQVTNFKINYNTTNGGTITATNDGGRTIQWKKKDAMSWTNLPSNLAAFSATLCALSSNGATLTFRLAPINGNGTNAGQRPSKEYSITVKKKISAPNIKVDDSKMAISLTKGMQYRYCDKDGKATSVWNDVDKTDYYTLERIAGNSLYDKQTNPSPVTTYIQFRTSATSSTQMSNITTIEIPAQTTMPSDILDKVEVEYTSKTSMKLTVGVASSDNPYEYCIINQDDIKDGIKITDFTKVSWKAITSSAAITITQSDNNVKDGSLIYLRKKAYKSLGDDDYEIASPYILLTTVCYPGDISTENGSLICLTTTVGVCNEDNSEGYLTFTMYSPVESKISTIKFVKEDDNTQCGEVLNLNTDFRCTVTANPSAGSDNNKKYIITTTIISTAKIDSAITSNEKNILLGKIKLEGGNESFESSIDNGGIVLVVHPKTVVNNPTTDAAKKTVAETLKKAGNSSWDNYNVEKDFASYTTSFTRRYLSNRICPAGTTPNTSLYDANQFRVRLDIGTRYIADKTKKGGFTSSKVSVTKIKYDGVEMINNGYYTVEYADIVDDNKADWEKRMAIITFNVDKIETNAAITSRDVSKPVYIYLSNGEVISSVTLKLQSTVTLKNGAQAINFTEGSIPEKETTTVTENGVTTVTETELGDKYSIDFVLCDSSYNVVCTSAKWNGYDVLSSVSTSNGVMTVTLSNKKLNAIDVASTTTSYITFTFDNGFETDSACKLTIVSK